MSTDRKEEQTTNTQPTQTNGVAPTGETTQQLITALQQNWQREMQGMRTYRDLAHNERDLARRNILEKLAEAEARHAQKWERKLAELGSPLPQEERTLGTRFKGWLHRQLGTEATLRRME